MRPGTRVRAAKVGVGFTSRVENENLECGDFPSDALICKLAKVLDGDADEVLVLARRVPLWIRRGVLVTPEAFRRHTCSAVEPQATATPIRSPSSATGCPVPLTATVWLVK
jgi:hypothetical protein